MLHNKVRLGFLCLFLKGLVMVVFEFDGGYNRKGTVEIKTGECLICKEKRDVLCIDSSEGEYAACIICFKCIKEIDKNRFKKK